jgi:hypothetical protein
VTSVHFPRDDTGIHELKRRLRSDAIKPLDGSQSYEKIDTHQQEPVQSSQAKRNRRKKRDRRQNERRRHADAVLLDTRSHKERRLKNRRKNSPRESSADFSALARRGIDETV